VTPANHCDRQTVSGGATGLWYRSGDRPHELWSGLIFLLAKGLPLLPGTIIKWMVAGVFQRHRNRSMRKERCREESGKHDE